MVKPNNGYSCSLFYILYLNPKSSPVNPTPYTLNPESCALKPKPHTQIMNLKTYTFYPMFAILDPRP